MFIDSIAIGKSDSEVRVDSQAAAATLRLETSYSLVNSSKIANESNQEFSKKLFLIVIACEGFGKPIILADECMSSLD